MKILKIVNSEDDGGVFTCEEQFIRNLRQKGHIVDLVIVGRGARCGVYEDLADSSIILQEFTANLTGSFRTILKEISKMRKFANANYRTITRRFTGQYDSVLYRRPIYLFLAGKLSQSFKCSAFWHMPNIVNSKFAKIFYFLVFKYYNIQAIANSLYTKRSIESFCNYVVYPGFDSNRVKYSLSNFREELNISPSAPVYGMVARVCHDKAQDLLVEAFCKSEIIKKGGHLVIAGAPESLQFLDLLKKHAGSYLDKQVHFIGKVSELPKFYSTIDIAVNSRRNVEAFGISVAEALGAAKPILAYKLGGPSEMVETNNNGWLIDEPTVDNYEFYLNKSIADRNMWVEMGRRSKEKSIEYEVEYNVDKLISIIKNTENV